MNGKIGDNPYSTQSPIGKCIMNFKSSTSTSTSAETQMAFEFQQGNESALEYFFRSCYPAMCVYANGILKNRQSAEEIASWAFLKAWKFRHKLDSPQGIRAYLYRIVHRDSIRAVKKSSRNRFLQLQETGEITDSHFNQLVKAETLRLLQQAVNQLSAGNKTVIRKYYFEDMTTAEIANELDLSSSTIKTQKMRGILILRKKFLSCL